MKPTPDPGFWRGAAFGVGLTALVVWAVTVLAGCTSGPPAKDNGARAEFQKLWLRKHSPPEYVNPWSHAVIDTIAIREADQARQIAVRALTRDAPVDQIIQLSMLITEYPWIGELLEDRITQAYIMPFGPAFDLPDTVEFDKWTRVSFERSLDTLLIRPLPTINAFMDDASAREVCE